MKIKGYEVVFEWIDTEEGGNWSAYFPDGPPVFSTGETREEIERLQEEGLDFWLEHTQGQAMTEENGAHAPG